MLRTNRDAPRGGNHNENKSAFVSKNAFKNYLIAQGKPITRFLNQDEYQLLQIVNSEDQTDASVENFLKEILNTDDGKIILHDAVAKCKLILKLEKCGDHPYKIYHDLGEDYPPQKDCSILIGDQEQLPSINKLRSAIETAINKSTLISKVSTTNNPATLFSSSNSTRDATIAAAGFAAGVVTTLALGYLI